MLDRRRIVYKVDSVLLMIFSFTVVAEYLNDLARALLFVSSSQFFPLHILLFWPRCHGSHFTLATWTKIQNLENRLFLYILGSYREKLMQSCIVMTLNKNRLTTGCIGFQGWGFQPLRGSKFIEAIGVGMINNLCGVPTKSCQLSGGTVVPNVASVWLLPSQ